MAIMYFVMGQADLLPVREPIPDYSAYDLNGKVGEYRLPDGRRVLLTFSARGGLRLYALDNARFSRDDYLSRRIAPDTDGVFSWLLFDGETERTIQFADTDGRVTGFEFRDENDNDLRAERLNDIYRQEDIRWDNGDIRLGGTAFVPNAGARTGAVIIHGSGDSDRDNLWYLHIVLQLAHNNVAVLLPDKRGNGKSGGDWRVASVADLVRDVLSGRSELSRISGVPLSRIGLVGISQGGKIAPAAATLVGDLPFIVNISGSTVTMNEALAHETIQNLRMMGVPSFLNFFMHPYAVAIAKRRRPVWWEKNGNYDPMRDWSATTVPALVIYGREDEHDNVAVQESVRRLQKLMNRPDTKIMILDDVGHGLMDPDSREMRPEFLTAVSDWALTHTTNRLPEENQTTDMAIAE